MRTEPTFKESARAAALAGMLVAAAFQGGCAYMSGTDSRESFAAQDVRKIEPSRTTKREILDWFGPPAGIARQGQGDKVIPLLQVRAETLLELFSARQTLNESDIVYYYRNLSLETQAGVVFLAGHSSRSMGRQELWVLIDDRSGAVRDYITKGIDAK